MMVAIIMVIQISEVDKMYRLRDPLLTQSGFSVCNHVVSSVIMRVKEVYQLHF